MGILLRESEEESRRIMGIQFAPLNIPILRRAQTGVVLFFVLQFMFSFVLIFFFIYLLFTSLFFLPAAYFIWFYYDRNTCEKGGRRWSYMRNHWIYKQQAKYFPITLIKTVDIPPDTNYIFGLHPHGIFSFSHAMNFGTEATGFSEKFPGIIPHLITLRYLFMLPIMREFMYAAGACSSSSESISAVLSSPAKGNAAAIIVGGAREVLNACPKSLVLHLKDRKGFVKMALRHGASLVPVLSFGENELYSTFFKKGTFMDRMNHWLISTIGYPIPLFYGRGIFQYSFGILPYRKPIVTVVGEPIPIEKIAEPSQADVDRVHTLYIEKLEQLFEQNKHREGVSETVLKIK